MSTTRFYPTQTTRWMWIELLLSSSIKAFRQLCQWQSQTEIHSVIVYCDYLIQLVKLRLVGSSYSFLFRDLYSGKIFDCGFVPSCYTRIYFFPQTYMQHIRGLPINDTPDMFGLHENANITFAMNETFALLNGILLLQPKSSAGAGQSREEVSISWFLYDKIQTTYTDLWKRLRDNLEWTHRKLMSILHGHTSHIICSKMDIPT